MGDGMGKGTITRERILAESLTVFSTYGYEGARVDTIAAQVGINKASLYFHFKSKEEIFRELFENITEKYRSNIKRIINITKDYPTKERLTAIYRDYMNYDWNNTEIDFWNHVYYCPPAMMKQEIHKKTFEIEEEFLKQLIQVFDEGITKKEIRCMQAEKPAKLFYFMLMGVSISVMNITQNYNDMEHCFELFWEGIKSN